MGPTPVDKSNKLETVLEGTHDQQRCLRIGLNQECVLKETHMSLKFEGILPSKLIIWRGAWVA